MAQGYSANDLTSLKGLEPVRARPGMYIGSTDVTGLHHLIWELIDNAVDEANAGYGKNIYTTYYGMQCSVVSMELHLDASIDKLDNLAMNVQLDKEKHMENAKTKEQTEPERAEAERVEAEVVYSPMVAEPQEYQYNADAFEARGVDEVKQEAAHKEAPKVREDKAR